MTQPTRINAEPGSEEHMQMVKAIMRIEQVVTEALPETSPNQVMLHVNAMAVVMGTLIGKLKSVELLSDVDPIREAITANFEEGIKIGEAAGRRTIMEHFGELH